MIEQRHGGIIVCVLIEQLQYCRAAGVDPVGWYAVAWEREASQRILDDYGVAIPIFGIAEVAENLGCGRHANLAWRSGHQLPLPLLGPEEECLVLHLAVEEFARQPDGPADVIAEVVVAIEAALAILN